MSHTKPRSAFAVIAGILCFVTAAMPLAGTASAQGPSFDEILYGRPCGAAISNYPDAEGLTRIIIMAISTGFLAANMEEDTVREFVLEDPLALTDIWLVCQESDNTLLELLTAARWSLPSDRL